MGGGLGATSLGCKQNEEAMDNNFIVSVCAIIIALASLGVAIWQGRVTRKHNILSVKPLPDILTSNFENRIAVTLENNGTGPLIIKKFRAYLGNESKSNIIDWMPNLPNGYYWSNWLKNFDECAIKPYDSKILLEFKLELEDKYKTEIRDNIRKALSKVSIEFEYTDIYDNNMMFPLHFLTAFERN
jgi:hypothetical protein